MNTLEIFKTIVKLLELPESALETKIGDFYTSLATDKRFVMLDGTWDLRSRHTSDKAVISVDEEDEVEELKEESEDADDIVEDDYDSNEDDDYDETEDELNIQVHRPDFQVKDLNHLI